MFNSQRQNASDPGENHSKYNKMENTDGPVKSVRSSESKLCNLTNPFQAYIYVYALSVYFEGSFI